MSILISFIAKNNDKIIRNKVNSITSYGPTISFIKNFNKKYNRGIDKVYILYMNQDPSDEINEIPQLRIVNDVISEAKNILPDINIRSIDWGSGSYISPIDHSGIFKALAGDVPNKNGGILRQIIEENSSHEYIIHLSPGTPAMHSIWLLITKYIQLNWKVKLFQSHKDVIYPVDMDSSFYDQIKTSVDSKSELNFFPDITNTLIQVRRELDIYKRVNFPILILGERGTGKTTLAKELRTLRYPEKKNDDWITVSCGQFDDYSMRSELFGHKNGAFTGATKDRDGLLKKLDKDLLFLDEVGDLSKETQRMIIRALDEKKFTPLGSDVSEGSDFTLVTATNKPIAELRKSLDPDFFDRISTVIINMPSIRTNRSDINLLFDQVFEKVKNSINNLSGNKYLSSDYRNKIVENLIDTSKFKLYGNLRDIEFVCKHYLAYNLQFNNESDAVHYALNKLEERESFLYSEKKIKDINIYFNDDTDRIILDVIEDFTQHFSLTTFIENIKSEIVNLSYKKCHNNASKTAEFLGFKNHSSINKYINKD